MSRSAVERRDELCNRSVFDYHELSKHFIETGLLSKSQAEKLVKGAALCTESPEKNVPWKEIAPELPHAAYKQLDELNFKRYTSTIIDHLTSESMSHTPSTHPSHTHTHTHVMNIHDRKGHLQTLNPSARWSGSGDMHNAIRASRV